MKTINILMFTCIWSLLLANAHNVYCVQNDDHSRAHRIRDIRILFHTIIAKEKTIHNAVVYDRANKVYLYGKQRVILRINNTEEECLASVQLVCGCDITIMVNKAAIMKHSIHCWEYVLRHELGHIYDCERLQSAALKVQSWSYGNHVAPIIRLLAKYVDEHVAEMCSIHDPQVSENALLDMRQECLNKLGADSRRSFFLLEYRPDLLTKAFQAEGILFCNHLKHYGSASNTSIYDGHMHNELRCALISESLHYKKSGRIYELIDKEGRVNITRSLKAVYNAALLEKSTLLCATLAVNFDFLVRQLGY